VMSTPAYVDSETITQADGAQSSRVPVPLPDDPYVAVRQAQLVDIDTESDPEKAPSEAEELQSLGSRVPLMGEEFEAFEPTADPIPGMSARITEAAALSPSSFFKRYRSSCETSSSSSSSFTLPGLEEEGPGIEEEEEKEAALEGQQQTVPVVDTSTSEPLGLGYGAARRRALESTEEIAPSTYEVGQSSRSVPEQEGVERIYAFRQSTLVTWVNPEDGRVYTDILTYAPPAAPVQTLPSPE
ncbi:hypothetical protein Tco_1074158, partial [Tanacetum coccineum]